MKRTHSWNKGVLLLSWFVGAPRSIVIVFVVSQAFNRLGEDFSFFSIKRKVFPYDPI